MFYEFIYKAHRKATKARAIYVSYLNKNCCKSECAKKGKKKDKKENDKRATKKAKVKININ